MMTLPEQSEDALVQKHLDLVGPIAHRLAAHLQAPDLHDLRSAGSLGLLNAIRKFDPSRGVPFTAYACLAIRRAMIDEIRRNSWGSRANWREIQPSVFLRLDAPRSDHPDGDDHHEDIEDTRQEHPLQAVARQELVAGLAVEMAKLARLQEAVVQLYYFRDMNLRQIGHLLGLTLQRICQLRSAALKSLKTEMLVSFPPFQHLP